MPGRYRFDRFVLDPVDRRLSRDGVPVELNARYLDALVLLVAEADRLVSKDRFLDEVWRGVPVTDEALTQCIRTLRRQLGDDAARPRFIETAPKHGYRFIAPVERIEETPPPVLSEGRPTWPPSLLLGVAGMLGGGTAGLIGGLVYGFIGASRPDEAGVAALSVLLVLTCLTTVVGLLGGAGVGFGLALANRAPDRFEPWGIAGAAAGGLMVGAVVKLLGLDAFSLLVGQSPGDVTGASEGFILGGAVGLGAWLGGRLFGPDALRRPMLVAGLTGGVAGVIIALTDGRLMGGSLDLLSRAFTGSRLNLDPIGAMFGEAGLGPIGRAVTGGLEGLLFGACVVGAMILARRRAISASSPPG